MTREKERKNKRLLEKETKVQNRINERCKRWYYEKKRENSLAVPSSWVVVVVVAYFKPHFQSLNFEQKQEI